MSTTQTLQSSVNYAQSFGGFRPLAIGNNLEPVITAGNLVLQTIISPPFSWNWNRDKVSFPTVAGTQDYPRPVSTFGFIEKASYKIPAATITNTVAAGGTATYTATNNFQAGDLVTITGTTNGSGVFNITSQTIATATSSQFTVQVSFAQATAADTGTATVGTTSEISNMRNILGTGTELGAPNYLAPQIDDNAGNITFRLLPISDRVYTVETIFQKRVPALMNALSSTWAPIPDHYSYIYQPGFLSLMMAYWNDPRWESFNRKFVATLLGAAEGLDEEQRNIFQAAWLSSVTEMQVSGIKAQQGRQGMGSE